MENQTPNVAKMVIKTKIIERVYRQGKLVLEQISENLTPDTGLAGFIKRMGGDGSTAGFTYLALGTGSTAADATDTALETEITDSGLQRASATVSYEDTTTTGDTLQLVKTFTATGDKTVTEIGVLNASSGGVLGGRVVKTGVPLETDDIYAVTYQIILSRA